MIVNRVRSFALVVLVNGAAHSQGQSPCPTANEFYDVGTATAGLTKAGIAAADIDADGDTDIVVGYSRNFERGAAILRNMGNGRFHPPERMILGWPAAAIAIADINAANGPDLMTVNYSSDRIQIALNLGNGRFSAPTQIPVGNEPIDIASADFDGDGDVDLAVANQNQSGAGSITLLRGNGDGSFASSSIATGPYPVALAAGDIDADTDFDLVVTEANGVGFSVLRNAGGAVFGPREPYTTGHNVGDVVIANIDGDLDPDLILTDPGSVSHSLDIRLNNGSGNFSAAPLIPLGRATREVTTADIDGDGLADIIATAEFDVDSRLVILRNLGSGSFAAPVVLHAGRTPFTLVAADLTGDTRPDLAVYDEETAGVTIILNRDGQLSESTKYSCGVTAAALASGLMNADDAPDLVVANEGISGSQSGMRVMLNDGAGGFGGVTAYSAGRRPVGVALGDFDRDGFLDVAIANGDGDSITVRRNLGGGALGPATDYPTDRNALDTAVGDLDGDQWPDIVVAHSADDFGVLWNLQNGNFAAMQMYPIIAQQYDIVAVDLDNDTDLDVAASNFSSEVVNRTRNLGNRTFGSLVSSPAGNRPLRIAAGDFNADGFADLACSSLDLDHIALLLNNGAGGFLPPRQLATELYSINSIRASDIDGDGDLDLVTGTRNSIVGILFNDNAGEFSSLRHFSANGRTSDIEVGNFDAQGTDDIAVANPAEGVVSVLSNVGMSARVWGGTLDQRVCSGFPLIMKGSDASGFPPLEFQWRHDGALLTDDGRISGAATQTLSIDPVLLTDAGLYELYVSNICGYVVSAPTRITVTAAGCLGDLDRNCEIQLADLAQLLEHFGQGPIPPEPPEHGDSDGDGDLDLADLARLLSRFGTRCP